MGERLEIKISDILQNKINSLLSQHGIVIWYDENQTFRSIYQNLKINNLHKVEFDGSFLKIRWQIDIEDPYMSKNWLIYVPKSRVDSSWLRELELIGTKFEPNFSDILKKEYNLQYGEAESNLLKNTMHVLLNLIERRSDEIKSSDLSDYEGILNLIFSAIFDEPVYEVSAIIMKFINSQKTYSEKIFSMNLENQFLEKINKDLGINSKKLEELVIDVSKAILFSDFFESTQNKDSFRFQNLLPERSTIRICASIAQKWRKHESYKQSYIELATKFENEYALENSIESVESGKTIETFKKVDEILLHILVQQLSNVTPKEALPTVTNMKEVSEIRKKLFWAKEGFFSTWDVILSGSEVMDQSLAFLEQIEQMVDTEKIVAAYVDDWWKIDYNYRKFIETIKEEHHHIDDLRTKVDHFYGLFIENLNMTFNNCLGSKKDWNFQRTSRQDRFWAEILKPYGDTPVALFMVDALRFEMGNELVALLENDFDVNIKIFTAIPPTITEVGMVAILPSSSKLNYSNDMGKFSVGYESPLESREDRMRWIEQKEDAISVFKLTDILRMDIKSLSGKVQGKRKIIVTSRDIDSMGESLETISLGIFSEVLKDLEKGIRRLQSIGIEHFILIADHGFLYTIYRSDADKISFPKGELLLRSKRFAIGQELPSGSYNIFTCERLGINGDFELAFPRGIACFRHPGGGEYLHGGLSVQEILIPCIILKKEKTVTTSQINIKAEFPKKITNLVFSVAVEPIGQLSLEPSREIEVVALSEGVPISDPISKTVENEVVKYVVKLKAGYISSDTKEITVYVRDTLTKELLNSEKIPVDILYGELGI